MAFRDEGLPFDVMTGQYVQPKSSKIIAVDFDGVLFHYNPAPPGIRDYPERTDSIGDPIWTWINKAKMARNMGAKLILWTCREGIAL